MSHWAASHTHGCYDYEGWGQGRLGGDTCETRRIYCIEDNKKN
jgi:hypothetical protein